MSETAMPCAWVGGALRDMQSRARAGGYTGVSATRWLLPMARFSGTGALVRSACCSRVSNHGARGRGIRRNRPAGFGVRHVEGRVAPDGDPGIRGVAPNGDPCFGRVALDAAPGIGWRVALDGGPHGRRRVSRALHPPRAQTGDQQRAAGADRDAPQSAPSQGHPAHPARSLADRAGHRTRARPAGPRDRLGWKKAAAHRADTLVPGVGRIQCAAARAPLDGSWCVHASNVPDGAPRFPATRCGAGALLPTVTDRVVAAHRPRSGSSALSRSVW